MSWAGRRRLLIVATIALVAIIIAAIILFFSFYKAPSCVDGIQNEQEAGVDCGGPCPYLCSSEAQAPIVRFTQAISGAGRTSVIAYIDNPNTSSYARSVSYQVSLYAANHTLAAPVIKGSIDLPAGATVPVYIPNIATGNAAVSIAFLALDTAGIKWQAGADSRVVPRVSNQSISGTTASPRVTATLTNPSTVPLSNIKVIAALYDASGNVVNASQTVVSSIPAQGSAVATFTWNAPFSAPVARIDILPLVPLPASVVSPTP